MPSWRSCGRCGARSTVPHAPTRTPPHACSRTPRPPDVRRGGPRRAARAEGARPDRRSRRRRSGPTTVRATRTRCCAHFGFGEFRPGQREAVQAALDGRDSLVVMPTGGGKSLCYQLPGIAAADLTVIVSPLIALMADQYRRLVLGGHPAAMIASGMAESAVSGVARTPSAAARRASSSALPSASPRRRSCRRSRPATWTCSWSTKLTACRNGATTSAPTTCACAP